MAQDILLLKLLHVPVAIIKFISKLISILTYLPNYAIILILDYVIFNNKLHSSFMLYCISWPIRFLCLNIVTATFSLQFLTIYNLLHLQQKQWYVQLFAIVLTFGGLLFLMRKGYLQMIAKYNPMKLKSPLQHVREYVWFCCDIIGIVLAVFNILLLTNAHKTLSYTYYTEQQLISHNNNHHSNHINHPFLTHITTLIHRSLIYNLTFFYKKVFFKIFPWRYVNSIEFVNKQQGNLFNLLVLLTLLFWQTMLDVVVVMVLGPVCVVHWKRNVFKLRLIAQQRKYRVALQHFGLILIQLSLLIITLPCTLINPTPSIHHLQKLLQFPSPQGQSQLFTPTTYIQQTFNNLFCSLMKLPAYFSLVIIIIFRYKYIKFNKIIIHQLNGSAKPVSYWNVDKAYMMLFMEQFVDSLYLPLIIIATVLRPFNIKWLTYLINDNYDLQRQLVTRYFIKTICDCVWWLPLSIMLTVMLSVYCFRKVFTVAKGYLVIYKNQSILQSITDQSMLKKYTLTLSKFFIKDLPHLPLYFLMTISQFTLIDYKLQAQSCYTIFLKVIKMFYIHRVKSSARCEQYFDMFGKDLASGLLQTQWHKMRFWKFAHKCQRHIMFTKILQSMVPKRRYQKKLIQIEKHHDFSQIANQYWYRHQITLTMLRIWLFFIIQLIIGLFGLLILAPLTLWRLPTFIIVFKTHKYSKRFFFKILFQVYKLMCYDLVFLIVNVLGFVMAPVSFVKFRRVTMFRYGNVGYTQLLKIQEKKLMYVARVLIVQTLKMYRLILEIMIICLVHIRKSSYLSQMKQRKITFSLLINSLINTFPIPTFTQLINPKYTFIQVKFGQFQTITNSCFHQSLIDIPYLFMALIVIVIMPWRIYYLKRAIKMMKQSILHRRQVTLVLKNVFKDYLCILINIVLLLSIVKTRKSLQMIRRNYRLNFFVGFLKYQYLKQLVYQLNECVRIYFSILLLILCLLIDWQHCNQLIMMVYVFYIQAKQLQDTKKQNQKMYKNTISQNKDLKIFSRIGFFQYVSLCQYLTVKQLSVLAKVNKMNYLLLQRQQVWIQKWENNYTQKYQQLIKGDTYKMRCIKAYQLQVMNVKQNKRLTFNQYVKVLFLYHMYDAKNDLPQMISIRVSPIVKQKYFTNYAWNVYQGYGPQNELPQQQNEDEEFLRLTNQVRRQRRQLKPDYKWYYDYLFVRTIESVGQLMNSLFRVNDWRRMKQVVFLFMAIAVPSIMMYVIYSVGLSFLFQIDRWIGVRILLTIYVGYFTYLLYYRLSNLYREYWISLKPFDLYYDTKDAIYKVCDFIRIKLILIKNFLNNKVYTPIKIRITTCIKWLVKQVSMAIKYVVNKVKYASKQFVDKVAAPLYMYCVQKLIAIKNVVVMLFKATKQFITFILKLIKSLIITFYQTVILILRNLNTLYYSILLYSRKLLMRFGIIGQLLFTIFGLSLMTLPSIICYFVYSQRWYIIVSTVHTAVLMVLGYRHLNKIRLE